MAESTMRAVVVTEPGPPDVLRIEERPCPVPGPDEVRVRVAASGLNRADLLQRRGRYPVPPGVGSWVSSGAAGTPRPWSPTKTR